jgi:hypothetical protein
MFDDERDWPPMAQMRQIITDCRQLSFIVPIGIVCVICGQFFIFIFVVSENSITFTLEFRRHSAGVRKDFTEKGVIEVTNL